MKFRIIPTTVVFAALALAGCADEGGRIEVRDSVALRDGTTFRFTATATDADVMAVYPQPAMDRGIEGMAVVECTFTAQGGFNACVVQAEDPAGQGFGAGAIRVMARYRFDPKAYPAVIGTRARQRVFFRLP